jgi:tetratricopeptide (TPR) repeat protein
MSESILWNEMGNLHMRLGSYEDAVSAYGKAIELAPDFSMAYNNLGHAYCSKGDYEGAIPLLKKSIDLSTSAQEQAIAWRRLGDAFQKQGNYDKALYAYKRGDELDALTSVGLINPFANLAADVSPDPLVLDEKMDTDQPVDTAGSLLPTNKSLEEDAASAAEDDSLDTDQVSDDVEAETLPAPTPPFFPGLELTEEELEFPDPVQLQKEEIRIESPADDYEVQADCDEEYVELNHWLNSLPQNPPNKAIDDRKMSNWGDQPTEPVIINGSREKYTGTSPQQGSNYVMKTSESESRGILLFSDQDLWGSVETTAQPREVHDTAAAQEIPSIQVLEQEKPSGAAELFKSWRLSEEPEHDPAVWKSMIEALEKKQAREQATAETREAQQTCPEPVTAEIETKKKANVSRELVDGIENYKKITSMAPLNDKAWDTLGKFLKDAGDFDAAVDAFQHAISICPRKDLYHYHLGLVFAAQKKHEDAVEAFKTVVEINPGYALAHCALAGSYRRLGMETEANTHIKAALPRLDAETEYNRACFEAICGNTDQAIELLKQALDKKQTSPEWVRGDPDLDFIREDPRFQALVGA